MRTMSKPYLEITYREGRAFAAYLYLDRKPGDKAERTKRFDDWVVDYASDGRAIGVEFTNVGNVDLDSLNQVLTAGKQHAISVADLVPLKAA
jgi:uncharacterized protein YuzE